MTTFIGKKKCFIFTCLFNCSIGRTGRIGHKGKSITYIDPKAPNSMCAKFVEQVKNAGQDPPQWLVQMAAGADASATDGTTQFTRDDRLPSKSFGSGHREDDW